MSDKDSEPQLGLFGSDDAGGGERWPGQERFPTNRGQLSVGDVVRDDLIGSDDPLLITGYASLAELLRFLPRFAGSEQGTVRLLIGHEPYVAETLDLGQSRSVAEPIREYWLNEGVDVELCYPVVQVREMIERGQIDVRTSKSRYRPVHAKIYVSEEAVTLGSSNFSTQGMSRQVEANARFTREEMRHRHARMLAERIWEQGVDFADELMALLAELLAPVSWQKALARACATLLEGEWAAEYIVGAGKEGWPNLWPSQRRGLAEAMWVIENVGSVLVADATGSGKTRMGAWLLRAIFDSVIERGGRRIGMPVLVSPPMVTEHWAKECTHRQSKLTSALPAGFIHHIDNIFGFDQRHPYSTPIEGLYSCSAGCHPGGSVIGAAGHNAAVRVARDLDQPLEPAN